MSESQTLVIGDIQGCFGGLMALLEKAGFDEQRDTLLAVGDVLARGEDSHATVKYLMDLGDRFCTVLGNHDLHFLAVSQGIKKAKKSDRIDPLLKSKKLGDYVDWFRQFPLAMAVRENTTMVHAGLYPAWSPAQLLAYSDEISQVLKGSDWKTLLENMYGNGPFEWKDTLKGVQRQRFIINACTRMRFIQDQKYLDFACKHHPDDAPANLTPWFSIPNPALGAEQRIIFGHWAALEGETGSEQITGLDTGYVWGNTLTALRLETKELISVSA